MILTDLLPPGADLVSAKSDQGTFAYALGTLRCELGTVPVGTNITITIVIEPKLGGLLTSAASVAANEPDPNLTDNSITTVTRANVEADLSLSQSSSAGTVLVGENLAYTFVITNHGPNPATNVKLTDALLRSLALVSAAATQGVCTNRNGVVICELGTLANGASATVTLVVKPAFAEAIINSASVTADQIDLDLSNNKDTTTTQVNPTADLSVRHLGSPTPAAVERTMTDQFIVTNHGPSGATDVSLTDDLPLNATFVSAESTQGTCTNVNGVLTCSLGELAGGGSATVSITLIPLQTGLITNTAAVRAREPDFDLSNNAATNVTAVTLDADLAIGLTSLANVTALGEPLTYLVAVTNRGPNIATGVVLTHKLPAGVAFLSAAATRGTCSQMNGTVVCTVDELPAGDSVFITIEVKAVLAGTLTSVATVAANEFDLDLANNTASSVITASQYADLMLTNTGAPDPSIFGNLLNYTLVVTNGGPQQATAIKVADVLPRGVRFLSAQLTQGTYRVIGGTVTCDLGVLDQGGSATITLTVSPGVVGAITNLALVTANETDLDLENNTATAVTRVIPFADIAVAVAGSPRQHGSGTEAPLHNYRFE